MLRFNAELKWIEVRKRTIAGMLMFALAACTVLAGPSAWAQSAIRPAVVVNDDVISVLDLSMRVRLAILASGVPDTPENRDQIGRRVLRGLIDERLQMQEAERLDIGVPQEEVDSAIATLAQRNNMSREAFMQAIRNEGILPSTLADQIRAQLAWRKVIERRLAPQITISQEEIDAVVERIKQQQSAYEYRLGEIFLSVPNAQQEDEVKGTAERLMQELREGASFSGLATQFSQSASAQSGGEVGWLSDAGLPENVAQGVRSLAPEEVGGPYRTVAGFVIVKVLDRRQADAEINRERIEQQLIQERLDRMAQRSLQELRRSANVDIRI